MATTESFAHIFRLSGTGTVLSPYQIVDARSQTTGLQSEFQTKQVTDASLTGLEDSSRLGDVLLDSFTVQGGASSGGGTYTYLGTATVAGEVKGIVATRGTETYLFTHDAPASFSAGQTVALNPSSPSLGPLGGNQWLLSGSATPGTVICFFPGTLISTPAGGRAVETLSNGDLVLTSGGEARPVRWMGRQTVSTRFADPLRVLPVRIRAGALGDGLPTRDLLVSPDHALLVEGILIQAEALVNGATVTRKRAVPEVFTYWHVELADHSLILAEGVPAETFVDNVERLAFDNWDEHEAAGSEAPIAEMALPRAKSARQVPMATRRRLAAHAAAVSGRAVAAA